MKQVLISSVLAIGLAVSGPAWANFNGNDWMGLDRQMQIGYVIGVYDGWQETIHFDDKATPHSIVGNLARMADRCLKPPYPDLSGVQLHAIIMQWMVNNRDRWGTRMSSLMWVAVAGKCQTLER
jgi:hypothetical protein